ncbi:MAG TPA: SLBB domain-containing protein, partial [Schlesneria sp.]
VSVGQLRQVSVVVSGEVNNPGVRVVTGLSTPLDAILLSGGVKKTGSLRSIKLIHAGQTTIVDLYSILLQGGHGANFPLSDGDRIVIPALGKTVAISGWVRRPGIYELSRFETALTVRRAIELAGGLEVRGRYRLALIHVDGAGNNAMSPVTEGATVHDSDVLIVQPAADQIENRATLSGATPLAGIYSVGKSTTLADVLKAPGALGTAPYTLFGAISRRDPQSQIRTLIPFTPIAVLNGSENMEVFNHDVVRVFTVNESRLLQAVVSAFKNRRSQSEAAMLTPESVSQSLGSPQPQVSSAASAAAAAAGVPNAANKTTDQQQQGPTTDQATLNTRNGVINDRRNIAELSTMVLGDGGVLVPNPLLLAPEAQTPGPAGSPQAILQSQQQQTNADQQRQLALSSMGTQGALQFQANQNTAQQSLLSQMQPGLNAAPSSSDYNYQSNANLPPNLQKQSVPQGGIATNQEVLTFGDLARQLDVDPLVLVDFLVDNQVTISGSVRGAGDYFVGGHASLKDVVAAAGGTSQ